MEPEISQEIDHSINKAAGRASKVVMSVASSSMTDLSQEAVCALNTSERKTPHAWLEQLMELEGPGILRLLYRMLGSEADVMDAYQDCFCQLAVKGSNVVFKYPRAYAYRTATNIAIEMIRKRTRRNAQLHSVAIEKTREKTADESAVQREGDRDRLRQAIAKLPQHLRDVLVLREINRLAYSDVAEILGIAPTTARVYRRYAVVQLAELLGQGEVS